MYHKIAKLLLFYVMGFIIAVAITGTGTAVQAGGGSHSTPYYIVPKAIEECDKCTDVCNKTLEHCKGLGNDHAMPAHIQALQDCIALCKLSSEFLRRNAPMQNYVCHGCIEACNKCADQCATMKDDKIMQHCARACRDCAEAVKAVTSRKS